MRKMLFMVLALSFAVWGGDEWKAIIMPNASLFMYCGEKICSKHDDAQEDTKEKSEKLNDLRETLGIDEERNKHYQGLSSIIEGFDKVAAVKDNVKSFRMCDSFAVSKSLAIALEFKKPVALDELKKLADANIKLSQEKIGGLDVLSLEPADPAGTRFAAIPVDKGIQLLLVGWSEAESLVARLDPAKHSQFTAEMKYLNGAATGDFVFCMEITPKIKQKINETAADKMGTDPMQAMALMKLSALKGILVDSKIVEDGCTLKLCFSGENAQGATVFREQLLDGLVLPMAQSLADNIAPGKISTANMLSSAIEGKMAVLNVNLKEADLNIIKETMK